MDILKFVVRSVMRGEVKFFRHRFSVTNCPGGGC